MKGMEHRLAELRRAREDAYSVAQVIGPHQLAADFGASQGATLPEIAHRYAAAIYAGPFVEAASQGALAGLMAYHEGDHGQDFQAVREACALAGPFAFHEGGCNTREVAEEIAETLPELDHDAVLDGAMLGFQEWLEALRL